MKPSLGLVRFSKAVTYTHSCLLPSPEKTISDWQFRQSLVHTLVLWYRGTRCSSGHVSGSSGARRGAAGRWNVLVHHSCTLPPHWWTSLTTTKIDRPRTWPQNGRTVRIAKVSIGGTLNDEVEEVAVLKILGRKIYCSWDCETRWRGQGSKAVHKNLLVIHQGGDDSTRHGVEIILGLRIARRRSEVDFVN